MAGGTTRIVPCPHCGRPRLEGRPCPCEQGSAATTPAPQARPLVVDPSFWGSVPPDAPPRRSPWDSTFARSRALRVAITLPILTVFLIWSAFTPGVMVRATALAVCSALLILLVLPEKGRTDG